MKSFFRYSTPPIFLLACFMLFTAPLSDGDCFWHIVSGQWIWEHQALPVADYFSNSFSPPSPGTPEEGRINFILKQYWLAQLLLAGVWKLGGVKGIILLRAGIYSATIAFLYWWLRRQTSHLNTLFLLIIAACTLHIFPNERPQLVTFLFTPILLWFLEDLAGSDRPRLRHWLGLPAIMLLWANSHGGFTFGVLLILLYLADMLFALSTGRGTVRCRALPLAISLAASLLNPNGAAAFAELFAYAQGSAQSMVFELVSPFTAAAQFRMYMPAYWIYLLVSFSALLICRRTISLRHLAVVAAVNLISLTAVRYTVFPILVSPIVALYLRDISRKEIYATAVAFIFALSVFLSADTGRLRFSTDETFPAAAAGFMNREQCAPNLFNFYEWGGYLQLHQNRLQTFIDGRLLDLSRYQEFKKSLLTPGWRSVFDKYSINTVLVPGVDTSTALPFLLVLDLAQEPSWHLVFSDRFSLLFLKETPANAETIRRYVRDKKDVHRHILAYIDALPSKSRELPSFWLTRGNSQHLLGENEAAVQSLRKALALAPDNRTAQEMLDRIQR